MTAALCSALEECVSVLVKSGGNANVLKKMKSLLSIAKDPWYHPVLKRLMSGESPPREDCEFTDRSVSGNLISAFSSLS